MKSKPPFADKQDSMDYATSPAELQQAYLPRRGRYESMVYRRCGRTGLKLPVIGLGAWQNLSGVDSLDQTRTILLTAFDHGITYLDYGNNYGRPPGSAEESFGRVLRSDLARYRDELVVSTKAGYDMWPGPYGDGSSRKYLVASLDQSLMRMGLEYVDIFYSHRYDPETPIEETVHTLVDIVHRGKALYVGLSSYPLSETAFALSMLEELGVPCVAYQGSYSMFSRWAEFKLFDLLSDKGVGFVGFTPLAQGMLSDKYLSGIPERSRAAQTGTTFSHRTLTLPILESLHGLSRVAAGRSQTMAQMALAWAMRRPHVTSLVVGVSSVGQLTENVGALTNVTFDDAELETIDEYAVEHAVDPWRPSAT